MHQLSVNRKTSAGETQTDPMKLFNRGGALVAKLEASMGRAYQLFFQDVIPYAYICQDEKPWKAADLTLYDDVDDTRALYKFLKGAFMKGGSEKTASQQASVIAMLVNDGLEFADVEGVYFRCLLKLSYYADQLSKPSRVDLLRQAKDCPNVQQFESLVESKARGVPSDRQRKEISGSSASIRRLNQFDTETTKAGDTRPLADKLAEAATLAVPPQRTLLDMAIPDENRSRFYGFWLEQLQRRSPSMAEYNFWEALDQILIGFLSVYADEGEFSPEELEEFERLKAPLLRR